MHNESNKSRGRLGNCPQSVSQHPTLASGRANRLSRRRRDSFSSSSGDGHPQLGNLANHALQVIEYPLVNMQKTMENHHFRWVNPLLMAIFNSYVQFPEGILKKKRCLLYIHQNPTQKIEKKKLSLKMIRS